MGENNDSNSGNSGINITYETIFELLRREKNRDELQKLQETFFSDVSSYLDEKNKIFSPQSSDMFSESEKDKTQKQVANTKRMTTELFERREKKIIILALNKVRTSSSIADYSAMLPDEKIFFNRMVEVFTDYRNDILTRMFSEVQIKRTAPSYSPMPEAAREERKENIKPAETPKPVEQKPQPAKKTKTIRLLSQVPKFMGKELEVYGPFSPDDMASLPAEIADVLIRKGRAEEIQVD